MRLSHSRRLLRPCVALLATASLILTGCARLPSQTPPVVISSFAAPTSADDVPTPQPDREPDLLLRDFISASTSPASNHEAARAFLTTATAQTWRDSAQTLVVNRVDINSTGERTQDQVSYTLRGSVLGRLGAGGAYTAESGTYEAQITLVRQDGQWRINSLPDGVVLERNDFLASYHPYDLYFFNAAGDALVPDRRWTTTAPSRIAPALATLLADGPRETLAPGVTSMMPQDATVAVINSQDTVNPEWIAELMPDAGVGLNFTGLRDMNDRERRLFAAQVVWTLAAADVPGPYLLAANGVPLHPDVQLWTTQDVAALDPRGDVGAAVPLHVLRDGNLFTVSDGGAVPLAGPLGTEGRVASADISADGRQVAAVRSSTDSSNPVELVVGSTDGTVEVAATGQTLTTPAWTADGASVWTVVDGRSIVRVARSVESGGLSLTEVDSSALESVQGQISVMRLSRDGTRAAMIIDGRVYLSVITRPESGLQAFSRPQQIAYALENTALSLEFQSDGFLLIGTSNVDAPVWTVAVDGSEFSILTNRNITAPVVAVGASSATYYVTDANSMMQLPRVSTEARFWREVPGLAGQRVAPIVAG